MIGGGETGEQNGARAAWETSSIPCEGIPGAVPEGCHIDRKRMAGARGLI